MLASAENFAFELLKDEPTGHDFHHVKRVVELSKHLCESELADVDDAILIAWLHDVGDYKLHGGKDQTQEIITKFFASFPEVSITKQQKIMDEIQRVSFSKGKIPQTLEGKIVQDADRLEALGAIGIARCFAYGGKKGNPIYQPGFPLTAVYGDKSSIHHFYEKLLKIKDLMNTESAKKIAEERHAFMETFLKQFFKELSD